MPQKHSNQVIPNDGRAADLSTGNFLELVQKGVEAWVDAGKMLVEMVKANPSCTTAIIEAAPYLSYDILDAFLRIGRNELYPYLMLDACPAVRFLCKLPFAEQRRLYEGEVSIARKSKDGIYTASVRVRDLTSGECYRVFDGIRIVPAKEQASKLIPRVSQGAKATPLAQPTHQQNGEPVVDEAGVFDESKDPRTRLFRELEQAQNALLRARQVIAEMKLQRTADEKITSALKAIGELRFQIRNPNG